MESIFLSFGYPLPELHSEFDKFTIYESRLDKARLPHPTREKKLNTCLASFPCRSRKGLLPGLCRQDTPDGRQTRALVIKKAKKEGSLSSVVAGKVAAKYQTQRALQ